MEPSLCRRIWAQCCPGRCCERDLISVKHRRAQCTSENGTDMKTTLFKMIPVALLWLVAPSVRADGPSAPGAGSHDWLEHWSFDNTNNWCADLGFAPVSFTNLSSSELGDGTALFLDSSNAWL